MEVLWRLLWRHIIRCSLIPSFLPWYVHHRSECGTNCLSRLLSCRDKGQENCLAELKMTWHVFVVVNDTISLFYDCFTSFKLADLMFEVTFSCFWQIMKFFNNNDKNMYICFGACGLWKQIYNLLSFPYHGLNNQHPLGFVNECVSLNCLEGGH